MHPEARRGPHEAFGHLRQTLDRHAVVSVDSAGRLLEKPAHGPRGS